MTPFPPIEIMAPAGNFECLAAAAQAGAHAVYFGVGNLNMRSHAAKNFTLEDLPRVTAFCREHGMRAYLTLNTVLFDNEWDQARALLQAARAAEVSAVIASDMGVICMARDLGLEVHISTQLNITNVEALAFYAQFADVVVLARELTLPQIKAIAQAVKDRDIRGPHGDLVKLELFCHGALCMSVSGKCYLSLHEYNHSANRGSCLQLCRRAYEVKDKETGLELEVDGPYIMSPKDLCTIEFLDKILACGVEVLKIEGRARAPEYVKTVTGAYRRAVDALQAGTYTPELAQGLRTELERVFNRGFWDGYYQGARLGQWSKVYGSEATQRKVYAAKVTNYFPKLGVAELLVEARPLRLGDALYIIGPTTGVVEQRVEELRLELEPVPEAPQGSLCSIPCGVKLRRSDKVYVIEDTGL